MDSDEQLTDRWEAGPLDRPVGHEDRVRIARVLIHRHGRAEATARLLRRISENCRLAGVPERFDADLTRRWADLIADAMESGGQRTFDEFIAAHPMLLQPDLLGEPAWVEAMPAEAVNQEAELPLTGGWVTSGVVRVGQTVRRPRSAGTPFVERLLRHLEDAGFDGAPRHRGFDEAGREILTYIEGDVPSDCRATVWRDEQLTAMAELLRRFHDATSGSDVAAHDEVVCHNDFGPWNLVWRDDLPVGVIDFDNAGPGARLDDLGYAAWKALNLGLIDAPVSEQRRRLRVFTVAYGVILDTAVLGSIGRAQEHMHDLIAAAPVGAGRDEALDQNRRERAWLDAHGSQLVA